MANRSRSFVTKKAAEKFDRKVKDLKAAGELDLLDEQPRGTITLRDYVYEVWWPNYAEVNLTDEGRANYSVQLDLRIIPKWGDHQRATCGRGPSRRGCPSCARRASATRRSSRP